MRKSNRVSVKWVQNKHYLVELYVMLYLQLLQQHEDLVMIYYPIIISIHSTENTAQSTQFFAVFSQDILKG